MISATITCLSTLFLGNSGGHIWGRCLRAASSGHVVGHSHRTDSSVCDRNTSYSQPCGIHCSGSCLLYILPISFAEGDGFSSGGCNDHLPEGQTGKSGRSHRLCDSSMRVHRARIRCVHRCYVCRGPRIRPLCPRMDYRAVARKLAWAAVGAAILVIPFAALYLVTGSFGALFSYAIIKGFFRTPGTMNLPYPWGIDVSNTLNWIYYFYPLVLAFAVYRFFFGPGVTSRSDAFVVLIAFAVCLEPPDGRADGGHIRMGVAVLGVLVVGYVLTEALGRRQMVSATLVSPLAKVVPLMVLAAEYMDIGAKCNALQMANSCRGWFHWRRPLSPYFGRRRSRAKRGSGGCRQHAFVRIHWCGRLSSSRVPSWRVRCARDARLRKKYSSA